MLRLCNITAATGTLVAVTPAAIPDADLVAAGRRAFARFGFHGATIERIAAEAGVSRVTLHRRGITREVLLEALVDAAITDYRQRMWPVLTASAPAAERLRDALTALCDAAEDHMALLLALRAQSDAVFHQDDPGETLTRSVFTEPLRHLLAAGAEDGTLRPVDPDETATVLFNLVGWTYIHLRTGHRWTTQRARTAVIDAALHGAVA